jgi:hypothetical protein
MKLLINKDQRMPLTIRQIIGFLKELDPDETVYVLHEEGELIAAPLTEILVAEGQTKPEFISMLTRDKMIQKHKMDYNKNTADN